MPIIHHNHYHNKVQCEKIKIDAMVSPQDDVSTHTTSETMKSEGENLDNNALYRYERSLIPPLPFSATAIESIDEELRLNELQITLLQERIDHRNRVKLANITSAARHEFVYCPNNSWKIININQQSVLQQCQFPCVISKAALWRFNLQNVTLPSDELAWDGNEMIDDIHLMELKNLRDTQTQFHLRR